MMRSIILIFLLTLVSPLTVFAESLEMELAEKAFLLDLDMRVTANYDINLANIHNVQRCLQVATDQEFESAKAPTNLKDLRDPAKFNPLHNCTDAMAHIKANVASKYLDIRRDLLLSQLLTADALHTLVAKLIFNSMSGPAYYRGDPIYLGNDWFHTGIGILNPLSSKFSFNQLPRVEFSPLEISMAVGESDSQFQTFNQIWKDTCQALNAPTGNGYFARSRLKYTFCLNTRLRMSESGLMLVYTGHEDQQSVFKQLDNFRDNVSVIFEDEQEKIERSYMTLVQLNPYVALVRSANPSRAEFVWAFATMAERAEIARNEYRETRVKYHFDDPTLADQSALLKNMEMLPVAQSLVDRPGPNLAYVRKYTSIDPEKVLENLTWSSGLWGAVDGLKVTGEWALANAAVCWLPWARVGRVVSKIVRVDRMLMMLRAGASAGEVATDTLSLSCFSLSTTAFNAGIFWGSLSEYDQIYRQVFSSTDNETLMRDVNALSEESREVFWSLMLMPVGTGAYNGLKKIAKGIPQVLWNKMEAAQLKLRPAH